jgi:uncharacterized membrane protein
MDAVEGTIIHLLQWLRLAVEATGALVIAVGAILAIYGFGRALVVQRSESYVEVRLTLARYLALAIEFELAADILPTAIAPSWNQIGKLGAIVVIRTGLNYFLMREMREERVNGVGHA